MDQQKVFIDLDRAHRLIGKVKLRLAISNLLPPKMPELAGELAEGMALIAWAHEQMRKSNRRI